jgi:exoribonuclease II
MIPTPNLQRITLMLNKNALDQLAQLKNTLVAQKDIATGQIRTTTKRFGFVILSDGREAFIDPDQMQRVLPDDQVEVEISLNAKNQFEAKLIRLIQPGLQTLVGRCVSKGSNLFIEPDHPHFNRWLFIPPQERKSLEVGDWLHAQISRHPFNNEGKAQVHVLQILGKPDEPGLEARYALAKFELPCEWTATVTQQTNTINWTPLTFDNAELDLTQLPFITIDAENTRDMDDAIYLQQTESYWELFTAIADPSKHIEIGSPLEQSARERANTLYLLGQTQGMLPSELSQDTYSLVAEQKRSALVCRIKISYSGEMLDYQFCEAQIRSHHKLSYQSVFEYLDRQASTDLPETIQDLLKNLQQLTEARLQWRQHNTLVMEDKADYFYILNDQKKIDHIEKRERNIAHRIVEEAMLVTNYCAGNFFSRNPGYGIFSIHSGFRTERLDEAKHLLQQDQEDLLSNDLTQLESYCRLFRTLRQNRSNPKSSALHSLLQRMQQTGALSFDSAPHFGLGFPAYAMVTSPIRRYQDYYNHLAIKALLRHEAPPIADAEEQKKLVENLQSKINTGRQASRFTEHWLCCQYAQNHLGTLHTGTISLVNSQGIGVKLDDWGIDGFVMLVTKDTEKQNHFDSGRLRLTLEGKTFSVDEKVKVLIESVDMTKRRIQFQLVDDQTAERLSAWM